MDMPSCGCARPSLTSLTFGPGIVLLRCAPHEAQSWVVDGAETASADALASLKGVFVELRGQRQPLASVAKPAPQQRADVPEQPTPRAAPAAGFSPTDAQLTAALQARGLSGSWSVA